MGWFNRKKLQEFKVFHNFIRKSNKDKLTPAQRAGIETNGNRWETILLNSISEYNKTPNKVTYDY